MPQVNNFTLNAKHKKYDKFRKIYQILNICSIYSAKLTNDKYMRLLHIIAELGEITEHSWMEKSAWSVE